MSYSHFLFSIESIHCGHCKSSIETALFQQQQQLETAGQLKILSLMVDVASSSLRLEIDASSDTQSRAFLQSIARILEDIGHPAQSWYELNAMDETLAEQQAFVRQRTHGLKAVFAIVMAFIYILMSQNIFVLTPMSMAYLSFFAATALVYLAWPFVCSAWHRFNSAWQQGDFTKLMNMDSLFVITGSIILLSSVMHVFFPLMPSLFEAGFLIFGFRHLGCLFQAYLDKKIQFKPLSQMIHKRDYHLANGRKSLGHLLQPDDVLDLKAGDILPKDAKIISVSADCELRDILGTGSYLNMAIPEPGQCLEAGIELLAGQMQVCLLSSSRFLQMDAAYLKIKASEQESQLQQQMTYALQWFIPGIIVMSILFGLILAQFYPISLALKCTCAILVSACPCTLGLIVPMALQMGARIAIRQDITYQNSRVMELAAKVDAFVFDYNGTLSQGMPVLSEFQFLNGADEQYCLQIISILERHMLDLRPHPLGQQILQKTKQYIVDEQPISVHAFQDLIYAGAASFGQKHYWFGNNQLLKHLHLDVTACPNRLYLFEQDGSGPIQCLAYVDVEDRLRSDAKMILDTLKQEKKAVFICTGADVKTAEYIAEKLDIEPNFICAQASIDRKSEYISKLKQAHPNWVLAMVGDAINDKHAFKASDISVLLKHMHGHSSWQDNLEETADIVIHSGRLSDMFYPFEIAELTEQVIWQNLYFSIFYNLLSFSLSCYVLLGFGIAMPPVVGVALMVLQSALLIYHTYSVFLSKDEALRNMRTETVLAF